jgi:hypothetical protein
MAVSQLQIRSKVEFRGYWLGRRVDMLSKIAKIIREWMCLHDPCPESNFLNRKADPLLGR